MKKTKNIVYKNIDLNSVVDLKKCIDNETFKQALRQIRQEECFKFVDRPIWYNKLSEMQKQEINKWYEDWLSVTDTFVIPERPYWVK
jgi:hypothetical protein